MAEPEIILGPPGTGKTTTLLDIVDNEMVSGTPPDRVGFVTFTRRGAETAISRAAERFKLPRSDFPHFRTLHSLAYRTLGLRPEDVMERDRLRDFSDYAGVRVTGTWCDDGTFAGYEVGDRVLFMENLARMRGVPLRQLYDEDDDRLSWGTVDHVSRCYAAYKTAHGLLDYTGMLQEMLVRDTAPALDVLLVDESQDLSILQWRVVWRLAQGARRVVIAGDDDQALYVWAGADVDTLVNMQGSVRVLGRSHRVPRAVQGVANAVIGRVAHRRPKAWEPRDEEGSVGRELDISGCNFSGEDILVLARNNYVLQEQVEPELRRRGVLYDFGGRSAVSPAVLRAVQAWEKLRSGGSVSADDANAVYSYMTAGEGVMRGAKAKLKKCEEEKLSLTDLINQFGLTTTAIWHDALTRLPPDEISYMLAARRAGERLTGKARVRLSTIHGSKGGEADEVILMTEMARRSFVEMERNEDGEARVFYVGATRARQKLTIVDSLTDRAYPYL
jgi:DNA helicase-2/ATP-dependent DNA helicase PcrA